MKIKYNAPVILSFTLISLTVMLLSQLLGKWLTTTFFALQGGADFFNPLTYLRLFTHVIGHADWSHFIGNFTLILLLGPLLEEKYGSEVMIVMMLITAVMTGVLNILLFHSGLYGASGIVFMLIVMSSFTDIRAGEIPLTFILVAIIFLGKEILGAFANDNVSQFAHILGGICGSIFGFFYHGKV